MNHHKDRSTRPFDQPLVEHVPGPRQPLDPAPIVVRSEARENKPLPKGWGSEAERGTIRAFHLGFLVLGLYAAAWLIVAWAVWE